jgi:hypothetical protein
MGGERMQKVLADELMKVARKFRRMFLEQTVADLGEVPSEPVGDEEVPEIDVEELGQEAYGDSVQGIVAALENEGIGGVEVEDVTTFSVEKDGKRITFEITTIESEPVVVIYTEQGRLTVSLAPLVGYVGAPEDAVDKVASDEDALEEFTDLVNEIVREEEVVPEGEEETDWAEEESEEDVELEKIPEEPEEEEVVERKIRRFKGRKLGEEAREYDMASGRRDITIGLIQDSDEKIGSIPVKTIDITKGVPELKGDGKEGMTFPNLYALFTPKEGLPDIQGFVSGEVKQGEEEKAKEEVEES